MICGLFNPLFDPYAENNLSSLLKIIDTNQGEKVFITIKSLSIGVFLNDRLPYVPEDFIFISHDKELIVIISGNVYNQKEILDELSISNKIYQPKLIAESFLKWGPEFVTKLNGDFSIVIYQKSRDEFFLFRDHLGVGPLAYSQKGSSVFFCSDFLSLCKVFERGTKINYDFLLNNWKYVDNGSTPNPYVSKLSPGSFLHYQNSKITLNKYWFPEKTPVDNSLDYYTALRELDSLLNDSIKIRVDNRFTAAAHLSGGIDSSLLGVLTRRYYLNQRAFFGLSWASENQGFPSEKKIDERRFVYEIAAQNDFSLVFSNLNIQDYIKYSKEYFFNLGYFWEEKTREIASQKKINLIFSGWGGDEFLSRGDRGVDIEFFLKLKWKSFFKKNPLNKPFRLIKVIIYNILLPAFGIMSWHNRKGVEMNTYYFHKKFKKNQPAAYKSWYKFNSRRDVHLGFLKSNHIPERCELWAIRGFKFGLEYRYPFLDKRIVEYILKIPSEFFFKNDINRNIIRDLSKGLLPEEVRLCNSKLDNSLFYYHYSMLKNLIGVFSNEVFEWRKNPDLEFINFKLLEKDINKFKKDPNSKNWKKLGIGLLIFKKLHEFTKTYRSLPDPAESDQFSIDQV